MVTGFGLTNPIALVNLSENASELSEQEIEQTLSETLSEVNRELESYSKLDRIVVFKNTWAEDCGFFTPTLKLKRHIVDAEYKSHYETWANHNGAIVWTDL
jgi:long-subunit acyl-CoA synthetase (AMP-forming)